MSYKKGGEDFSLLAYFFSFRSRLALTYSPSTRARSPKTRTEKSTLVEKVPFLPLGT